MSLTKPKLIIHPGFGRTGTSTIQYILRNVIKNKKISYNPKWLVNIFNDINRYKTKDKEYIFYFERIKDIFIKIKKGKKGMRNIILSMESIIRWDNKFSEIDIKDLGQFINIASNIYDVKVIISHRLPSDLTCSNYLYLKSRNLKNINKYDELISKEYLINVFSKLKNLESKGASNVNFIQMDKINNLDWLDDFGFNLNLSYKFKRKFSSIKLNQSPNHHKIIFLSLLSKYNKDIEAKLIELLYGSFLFNLYINIRSAIFKFLLFIINILFRTLNFFMFKIIVRKLPFYHYYNKKYQNMLNDLARIKKSHKEIDLFYLNNILSQYS